MADIELKDYLDSKFDGVNERLDRFERNIKQLFGITLGNGKTDGHDVRIKMLEHEQKNRRWAYHVIILTLAGLLGSVLAGAILNKAFGETIVKLGADYENTGEYRDLFFKTGFEYGKDVIWSASFKHKERQYPDMPEANTKEKEARAQLTIKHGKFNVAISGMQNTRKNETATGFDAGYSPVKWYTVNAGYVLSHTDYWYNMAVLKQDLYITKNFLCQYHIRSDFDQRPYEWWLQLTIQKKVIENIGLEIYLQFEQEGSQVEEERGILLTYKRS